jgi:hypothetical protein
MPLAKFFEYRTIGKQMEVDPGKLRDRSSKEIEKTVGILFHPQSSRVNNMLKTFWKLAGELRPETNGRLYRDKRIADHDAVAWKFVFIDNPCRHALGKHDQRIAGPECSLFNRMDGSIERALEPATAAEPKNPLQIMDYTDLPGRSREQTHHNQKEQGWGKYCNGGRTPVSQAPRCPARVPREPDLKDQSPQDHGARISHPGPTPMDGNILEPVSRSDRFP